MKCPKCNGEVKEQPKWPGLYTCMNKDCDWLHLTPTGAAQFDAAVEEARKTKDIKTVQE